MTDNTFILSKLDSKHKAHYEKSMLGEILGGILNKNIDLKKISQQIDLNHLKKTSQGFEHYYSQRPVNRY